MPVASLFVLARIPVCPRRAVRGPAAGALALAAIVAFAGLGPGGPGVAAAAPTVEDALAIKPKQKHVDYDQLTPEQAARATIGQEKLDGISALVVRGPGGEILRAFADTDGNRVVDRWSYYKDGIEVYRDIDTDADAKSDQARWLNSAGSRWAVDSNNDGVLDAWKVLSAEEATAEVVHALRDRDAAAFARLLPRKADLAAAGFEGSRLDDLVARAERAAQQFPKFASAQKQVPADARWSSMLTPQPPGTLPAGGSGVVRDVVAYDNVVALMESPSAGGGQLFIGSLVKCGDVWRPVDLPQVLGGGGEFADVPGFFTPQLPAAGPGLASMADERLKPLLAKLQEVEAGMTAAPAARRPEFAASQVTILEQILAAAGDTEKGFWTQQLVETVAAYAQEGLLPDGIGKLTALEETVAGDDRLGGFIAFRIAQARYAAEMQKGSTDGEKLQNQWFEDLRSFVERYPTAAEAAEAKLQLAFRDEFEGREQEAIRAYREIAADFGGSPQARKATGAVRRLEGVGKPLSLAGPTIDGKTLTLESLRGVPVLVHYWSTDCEPCKVDLAQIREMQTKYGAKQLAVVGVALDGDKARLVEYLRAKPLPWPQLYEPGGLDSRLAEDLGVLALPTMLLLDAQGNVIDRNVSITELERKLEAVVTAGR